MRNLHPAKASGLLVHALRRSEAVDGFKVESVYESFDGIAVVRRYSRITNHWDSHSRHRGSLSSARCSMDLLLRKNYEP